jgi:hypothetical protein
MQAWQDSARVAQQHAVVAVAAAERADRASADARRALDSARRAWRAPRPRIQVDTLLIPPDSAAVRALLHELAAERDREATRGDALDRSCTAYESACERAKRTAHAAIDSLQRALRVLEQRPPDPAARRLQAIGALGYDLWAQVPALRAGLDWRIAGDWHVAADVTRRLARGDTVRVAVWVAKHF